MSASPLPTSRVLPALLDYGRSVVPELDGRIVPDALPLSASAPGQARALLGAVSRRHAAAGRAHWGLRAWSLLVWQPIHLAVFAAEGRYTCVSMEHLQLRIEHDDVTGFSLPAGAKVTLADRPTCRARAARQIVELCATLLAAQQAVLPLSPRAALRVQADCVLAALLRLRAAGRLDADNTTLRELGEHWLVLMGADGGSGFFAYAGASGGECLAVDRRLCCLEHRLPGASMCSTCPKLDSDERAARLLARDRARITSARDSRSTP